MRLIDADALIDRLCGNCRGKTDKTGMCERCADRNTLGRLYASPTIDAVPVRHGEWEQVEVVDYDGISMNDDAARCTVCGHVEQSVYWARTYYHYCPNCGARMDGQEATDASS